MSGESSAKLLPRHETLTKRQKFDILKAQVEIDFSSFKSQYQDLNDYILPTRARFFTNNYNKGDRRNLKIFDSTGTQAARTLEAGMMSGVTSPSRRWFKLETDDRILNRMPAVKEWLWNVADAMNKTFIRSNFYQTMPLVYGDLGTFATAPFSMEEDFKNVLYTQSFPIGSYRIAKDNRGRVNVFYREWEMTIQQLLEEYGEFKNGQPDWSNFSQHVKTQYDQGNYQTKIQVCHIICPNNEYDPRMLHSKYKKFSSCHYESGFSSATQGNYFNKNRDDDIYLREKGYDYFPVLCPRWRVTGEDVYGTDCPGMMSIGDIKQLQWGEKRIAQAIDTLIKPPMKGPASLRSVRASTIPGDMTYVDEREGTKGFTPVYQIDPRIQEMEMKQAQVRERIKSAYYENLFLAMIRNERSGVTAREVSEVSEEKLMALGPVMEQMNQDGLDPAIDICFELMLRQRRIPPPPEELRGRDLRVEYISIMAQYQKMIGISSIERYLGFAANTAATYQGSLVRTDADKMLEHYGEQLSMPPGIVRTDEEVAAIVESQQRQQAAQQKMAMLEQGANAANKLAGADLSGDNALNRMIESAKSGGGLPTA